MSAAIFAGQMENAPGDHCWDYYPGTLVNYPMLETLESGGRLNIKTVLSTYGDFHVKDKTAVRTSYL